ncbi:cytochrome c biogenesis CcdA family protein [Caldalkalibacillus mannanilyticus]|uniref:cytochrome c biogenesis CcdA family protein n=1 Tax=Caldalkalibacillus mannanilyticus TaxID=1418 RepID=UPI00046837B4|nr:cytochrome c biogenesis protein CcdA [Caldalkalibacillus mannanilyticus]
MTVTLAFISGLLSFLSPCIIPLIPSHLAIISGISVSELKNNHFSRQTIFFRTFVFVCGLIVPLVLMGMSASLVGEVLSKHQSMISKILGFIVIFFGLHLLGLLRLDVLQKEYRLDSFFAGRSGNISIFMMGLAFGFGWTPCVGPFLGSTLIMASQSETVWQGGLLLFIYGIGLGVPFMIIGLLSSFALKYLSKWSKYTKGISILSGILLIIIGLLIVTDQLVYLNPFG